jgi:hypothetical protein
MSRGGKVVTIPSNERGPELIAVAFDGSAWIIINYAERRRWTVRSFESEGLARQAAAAYVRRGAQRAHPRGEVQACPPNEDNSFWGVMWTSGSELSADWEGGFKTEAEARSAAIEMAARYYAELLPPYILSSSDEPPVTPVSDAYHLAAGYDAHSFEDFFDGGAA